MAANPLPAEYAVLELSKFELWTPTDSLVVLKLISFGFTFDLDIDPTVALFSYQQAGSLLGFDGTKLFFEDLDRSAPFDPASTIPNASAVPGISSERRLARLGVFTTAYLHPGTIELAKQYLEKVKGMPVFQRTRDFSHRGGSNEWVISGAHSTSGFPLLANDPHAPIGTPSTFYPVQVGSRVHCLKTAIGGDTRQGGVNLATSQCKNSRARQRHGGIRASSRVFQRTQSACSTLSRLLCEKLAGYQIASTASLRSRLGMRSQGRPQRRERVRYFMLCGASRADMDGSCITSPLQSRSTNPWHRLVGRLPPATS